MYPDQRNDYPVPGYGDLGSLLALLDEPAEVTMFDDGLHRFVTSVAALRRTAPAAMRATGPSSGEA